MFIYEFKSSSTCLITKIVISGPYLTVYTSKKNCQEFNAVTTELDLKSTITGDHPSHVFCHTPFVAFSARGDSIPHKHLQFSHTDRQAQLKDFFSALLVKQNNPDVRQTDFDTFVHELNKERESYQDEVFPSSVMDAINGYDRTTPFLPADEVEHALDAFAQYLKDSKRLQIENVSIQAEKLLNDNWHVIYINHITCFENTLDKNEQSLCDYFDNLLNLRTALLALMSQPNAVQYALEAQTIIQQLRTNKTFQADTEFQTCINAIEQQINSQQKAIGVRTTMTTYLIESLISTTYFLYCRTPEESVGTKLIEGFLLPIIPIIIGRQIEQPLTYYLSKAWGFFSSENKSEEENTDHNIGHKLS
ncbi:MAG: hypothetical protein WC627_04445 [Legionella sp.]|jgi:hypothetical protein